VNRITPDDTVVTSVHGNAWRSHDVKVKSYASAEKLLRDHKRDPVRDLLDDVAAAVEAAEGPGEIAAIRRAANEAAASLDLDGDDSTRFDHGLARLTDPRAVDLPRLPVLDDNFQNTDRVVSVDEWAAENPDFAKAMERVRAAETTADAFEVIRALHAARQWDPTSDMMFELYRETELEDDGTLATFEDRDRAQHAAKLADAQAEHDQSPEAQEARATEVWNRLFGSAVAAAEGTADTASEAVTADA
jgi:hypothetical protein